MSYGSSLGSLCRQRCVDADGYDHRDAAADEIGCKRWQPIIPIKLIFRPAVLDRHILAIDIASFFQALEKRNDEVLVIVSGLRADIPDHRRRRLLRPRHHRPCRCAPKPRDERPAPNH
jgi:hypothetical protein